MTPDRGAEAPDAVMNSVRRLPERPENPETIERKGSLLRTEHFDDTDEDFERQLLLAHGPCICGDLATVEVVVRWRTGPRHYWYCEQHAATVLELEGVSRTGYRRGPR